jgi:AraC family transcriptional regulator of arabinose operon
MKKKEGFKGQESIVIPELIRVETGMNPFIKLLHVTDIGYYPKADHHYRERPEGADEHVLIYCTDGSGWFETDLKRFKISRNMYVIIPRKIPHKYGASERDPWSIYWVHFAGEKADLFAEPVVRPREIDSEAIARNADRILLFSEIYENLSRGFSIENLEYSSICLWHMLGSFRYLSQFQTVSQTRHQDMISSSISFMHQRINELVTLEDLSAQAGLSQSHYSLMFKRKTGQTPLGFFTHLKIQHACRLLEFSDIRGTGF